ncbi:transcription factor GTE7-like [Argentina anserina]|uniref:transcription factor GTE7-like n=1 Tax=Argentina anserina TaxID=57926 RepID=UPI0021768032|nr:transcription factor GTE7-like [Potentilla anserina]
MASAVLANRNEPNWPQQPRGGGGGGYMGKVPFSNPNRNPNPKTKFQAAQQHPHADFIDESPAVTQAASDDASSINHHRRSNTNNTAGDFNISQSVTFNVAAYSRKELAELKNRLLSELDQIRVLKNRIEAGELNPRPAAQPKKPKKVAGSKRPLPIAPGKDAKSNLKRSHSENANLMKNCGQILSKLMKHKFAWIFKTPVDVVLYKLHDYYDIIKRPMDLGTVKTNLSKNLYSTPLEFAADVRLTFENAMRYNPRGHEVYNAADQLRSMFEELFQPLIDKLGDGFGGDRGVSDEEELQASSWNHVEPERHPPPPRREDPMPVKIDKETELVRPPVPAPVSSSNPPIAHSPVRTSSQVKGLPQVKPLKQPKPKAKDPNKRDMSIEEKHKLGLGLQSLPQEKMDQVVQIIKKRNGHLKQDGDEIELDIEAVDNETLWELDRLVTNYKKMVSKIKRQALMGNNSNSNFASNRGNQEELPAGEKIDVLVSEPKRPKKGEVGDEDVDIGDDMPMSSFPPVEIEKDIGGNASSDNNSSSSSGSSSSGSSSSSDSDSGSSSGSDSDEDNAQS